MPHHDRSTGPGTHRPLTAETVLGLLDGPDQLLLCLVPVDDEHVDVAAHPLPEDPRGAAAALFGVRAPDGATAAGVRVEVAAPALPGEPPDEVAGDGTPLVHAAIAAAVDTGGGTVARLQPSSGGAHRPTAVRGPLVDALHRVLGLPAPGEPPMLWELALGWWLRDMVDLLAAEPASDWEDLVELHPALAGGDDVPDPRRIALATEDVVGDTSWSRLHALASAGPAGLPGLLAEEAAWMDATAFARWMVAGLPTAEGTAALLRSHAATRGRPAGRRLRRLASRLLAAEGVLRERSGLATPPPGPAVRGAGTTPR